MDKQSFYDLGKISNATFWTQGDASTRRTLIMPLTRTAEFLAFGVLSPSNTVHFMARGRLLDHKQDFIAQMKKAGSEVYPMEQKETDNPPNPPNLTGYVCFGRTDDPCAIADDTVFWPSWAMLRNVVVLPVPGYPDDVLAFGLCEQNSNDPLWKVPFVARLKREGELTTFTSKMVGLGVGVAGYTTSPYLSLQQYLDDKFVRPTPLAMARDLLLNGTSSNNRPFARVA